MAAKSFSATEIKIDMVKHSGNASAEHTGVKPQHVREAGTTMQGIVSQVNQVSDPEEQISRASQEQAAAMDLRHQAESLAREVLVFQHEKELVGA